MATARSSPSLRSVAVFLGGALGCVVMVLLNRATLVAESGEFFGGRGQLLPTESIRVLAAGELPLVSDLYWLGAIQYFGTDQNRIHDYRELPSYLDVVRGLDPDFCYQYVFAGEAVPYRRPDGTWTNTKAALRLLQAADGHCTDEWRIPFELGYLEYTFTDRYLDAAAAISEASIRPRAPRYLGSLATRLYGQEGELENAVAFARTHLAGEVSEYAREELRARIRQLQLEIDLRRTREAVQQFLRAQGRYPRSVLELVATGFLEREPRDPIGGSIRLGVKGAVTATDEDQLLRLHISPGGHLTEPAID